MRFALAVTPKRPSSPPRCPISFSPAFSMNTSLTPFSTSTMFPPPAHTGTVYFSPRPAAKAVPRSLLRKARFSLPTPIPANSRSISTAVHPRILPRHARPLLHHLVWPQRLAHRRHHFRRTQKAHRHQPGAHLLRAAHHH